MKKKLIVFSTLLFVTIFLHAQTEKRSGIVDRISGQDIIVKYDNANKPFSVEEKLHITIGSESITLSAVFPMQTFAKCRLIASNAAALPKIKNGMIVYSGIAPVKETAKQNKPDAENHEKTKIDDFASFLGFSNTDTFENVFKKLGQPSSFANADQITWGSTIEPNCYIGMIRKNNALHVIDILSSANDVFLNTEKSGTIHLLTVKGVKDPKLNYLGSLSSQITKEFGQPAETKKSGKVYSFDYRLHSEKYQSIQFYFSDTDDKCYRIFVYW